MYSKFIRLSLCLQVVGGFRYMLYETVLPLSSTNVTFAQFETYRSSVKHKCVYDLSTYRKEPERCEIVNCTIAYLYIHKCQNPPKPYPPCQQARPSTTDPFPYCCERIECPPYFTALDAFIYTITLIKTHGEAPLLRGTIRPNITIDKFYAAWLGRLYKTTYIFNQVTEVLFFILFLSCIGLCSYGVGKCVEVDRCDENEVD